MGNWWIHYSEVSVDDLSVSTYAGISYDSIAGVDVHTKVVSSMQLKFKLTLLSDALQWQGGMIGGKS